MPDETIQEHEEELFNACRDGKLDEAKTLLLQNNININVEFPVTTINNGESYQKIQTPLSIACCNGHKDIVTLLLNDERTEVNKTNSRGATAFFLACAEGQQEIVKLLLSNNLVDINKAVNYGDTPFHIACSNNHEEIVKLLLMNDSVGINIIAEDGSTPFFQACVATLRQQKYLNNIQEQDPRFTKRRVRHSQGFQSFHTAKWTIAGYETLQMIRKGRVKNLAAKDVLGQIKFINKLFGIAA